MVWTIFGQHATILLDIGRTLDKLFLKVAPLVYIVEISGLGAEAIRKKTNVFRDQFWKEVMLALAQIYEIITQWKMTTLLEVIFYFQNMCITISQYIDTL